jgi:hypothetical protein
MAEHTQDELDNELKALYLTPEDIRARLEIIYDAYLTTFRQDVQVKRGDYLNVVGDDEPTHCNVCFLGALFLSKVVGVDGELTFQLNNVPLGRLGIELRSVFDAETLAIGEALFEGARITCGPFGDYWRQFPDPAREGRLPKIISEAYEERSNVDAAHRARYILQHLIEHESVFNLETFKHEPADFHPKVLSKKALRVLERYGFCESHGVYKGGIDV